VVYEYIIARDREHAYDLEQEELDKWLGHPECLNVNNDARSVWSRGTMPQHRIDQLAAIASRTHAGQKYRLGMTSSEETRQRLSDSVRASWDERGRSTRQERPPRWGARGRVVEGQVLENMRTASVERGRSQSRSVIVDGNAYDNAGYAAKALGFTRRTVVVRIADERYPEWKYADS
jgi:hypothetical protein